MVKNHVDGYGSSDGQETQRSDPMSMDEALAELNGDSLT
jgi:hypothetical protein